MRNALNLLEFTSKICLELFLVLPLIEDNLSTMDKQLVLKVSSLWRFHCSQTIKITITFFSGGGYSKTI